MFNIEFEETAIEPNENDENQQKHGNVMNQSGSVESENLSSSLDEIHIDEVQAKKQKNHGTHKIVKPLSSQNHQLVPNVVKIGEIYEQKKKIRYQQTLQREREQRKFHAKPAPNFAAIHAASSKKRDTDEHKLTIPKTPRVVHTHRKYTEIIRKRVSSYFQCFSQLFSSMINICCSSFFYPLISNKNLKKPTR